MKEQCPLTDVDGREQVEIEWFYFSSSCYLAHHLLTVESELISISYQLKVKLHNSVSAEPHKLAPSSLSLSHNPHKQYVLHRKKPVFIATPSYQHFGRSHE